MLAEAWVAEDWAGLILVSAISITLIMLAGVIVYRGATRDELDTKRLAAVLGSLLAVIATIVGFLFGQASG